MSNIWKLEEICIYYPSFNTSYTILEKIYALEYVRLRKDNNRLDISFEPEYYSNLYKIISFNNIIPIDDSNINNTKIMLNKYNISFNKEDIDKSETNFFVLENDEDNNYDYKTNINLIESGNYGMPLKYISKLSLNNYDLLNDFEKKELENIIINDIINIIFEKI